MSNKSLEEFEKELAQCKEALDKLNKEISNMKNSPPKLTGWERVNEFQKYYSLSGYTVNIDTEINADIDDIMYKEANYFTSKELAEEIKFKQDLTRKLQRFADENNDVIDWNDETQSKFFIVVDIRYKELHVSNCYVLYSQGTIFFSSEEIAEKATELFKEELLKYFKLEK